MGPVQNILRDSVSLKLTVTLNEIRSLFIALWSFRIMSLLFLKFILDFM